MTPTDIDILVDTGSITRAEADAWLAHIARMRAKIREAIAAKGKR